MNKSTLAVLTLLLTVPAYAGGDHYKPKPPPVVDTPVGQNWDNNNNKSDNLKHVAELALGVCFIGVPINNYFHGKKGYQSCVNQDSSVNFKGQYRPGE